MHGERAGEVTDDVLGEEGGSAEREGGREDDGEFTTRPSTDGMGGRTRTWSVCDCRAGRRAGQGRGVGGGGHEQWVGIRLHF